LEPENYLPYLFGAPFSNDTMDWLHQSLKRNPHSLKSWTLLGEEYMRTGDVIRAIHCFESAAELFPSYEIPYVRTAQLLEQMGHREESLQLFKKAESLVSPLNK
jgi:tetratricopeptide (TPR) repeat protein